MELLVVFLGHPTLDSGYIYKIIEGYFGDYFEMAGECVIWVYLEHQDFRLDIWFLE